MKSLSVSEYLSRRPLSDGIIENFLDQARENEPFLEDLARYFNADEMSELGGEEKEAVGLRVKNAFVSFLIANGCSLSGMHQIETATQKEFL